MHAVLQQSELIK
uniref:Uncharacterized protein n=1 Tax=Schistosoma haematobium TaxID=6185 RepID=A0A094ZEY6_SCHHA